MKENNQLIPPDPQNPQKNSAFLNYFVIPLAAVGMVAGFALYVALGITSQNHIEKKQREAISQVEKIITNENVRIGKDHIAFYRDNGTAYFFGLEYKGQLPAER